MVQQSHPRHICREESNLKNTCISMFIETLFTRAKTWKQRKCPLTGEWMKMIIYIHVAASGSISFSFMAV